MEWISILEARRDFSASMASWIEEGQVALVAGVSMDANNGLLDYARDNALQIVVVAPERPDFMHAQDWFVEGLAEDVLPELTKLITI